jgi:hypothetical protein
MAWTGHEHEHELERERLVDDLATRPAAQPASERLASKVGNRAFGALVGRTSEGIMPDGAVHPDVQTAIGQARGGGMALDAEARARFAPDLGDPLTDVRVHTDAGADALARSVSARAFTTGSDMFFATGEYRPGSNDGDRLLAHELTHVVQQRGSPTSGPMIVSDPGDALETEAEDVARDLTD